LTNRQASPLAGVYAEAFAALGAVVLICNAVFGHPAAPMVSIFAAALLLGVAAAANQLRTFFAKRA
jgi:hypothetical protein